jgi:hypothetical protein
VDNILHVFENNMKDLMFDDTFVHDSIVVDELEIVVDGMVMLLPPEQAARRQMRETLLGVKAHMLHELAFENNMKDLVFDDTFVHGNIVEYKVMSAQDELETVDDELVIVENELVIDADGMEVFPLELVVQQQMKETLLEGKVDVMLEDVVDLEQQVHLEVIGVEKVVEKYMMVEAVQE